MNVVNRKPSGPGSLHCYVPRVCAVRAPCLAPVARSDDQLALSSYRTRSVSCRRPLVAGATVTEGPTTQSAGSLASEEYKQRAARLDCLICLRRLYRNIIRSKAYQATPVGIHTPYTDAELAELLTDEDRTAAVEDRKLQAVRVVADISLIIDQLEADMRVIQPVGVSLFQDIQRQRAGGKAAAASQAAAAAALQRVQTLSEECRAALRERVSHELPLLPFDSTAAAQGAVSIVMADALSDSDVTRPKRYTTRMDEVHKAAADFFVGKPRLTETAVNIVAEEGLSEALKTSQVYVSGLWDRLNGRGPVVGGVLPYDLPCPAALPDQAEKVDVLNGQIDKLEKELVELSKGREQKLRNTSIELRATMAYEMRDMDEAVLTIGRNLALRTLEVQLEYIYMSLEDEAREVLDGDGASLGAADKRRQGAALSLWRLVPRRGSNQELAILGAEYALLAVQLAALSDACLASQGKLTPALDEDMKDLAAAIPDMRVRLGIPDQSVFGGSGLSVRKAQMAVKDATTKLREGADFFAVGIKLLGSDVGYAGKLFARAALFNTLKPREVSALRRTVKDCFTFIPFTIILIIPLTPLGHVLIFGFIQRYFPNFFPSQFNARRQEMVKRYEELRLELVRAQEAADNDEAEEELQQAAAVVARLTNSSLLTGGNTSDAAKQTAKAAAPLGAVRPAAISDLKKQVAEANFDALTFQNEERDTKTQPSSRNSST